MSDEERDFRESFTVEERTVGGGVATIEKSGDEAPWLGPLGACRVKVYEMRRNPQTGQIQFGIGNETPPALGWVAATDFYTEWPN